MTIEQMSVPQRSKGPHEGMEMVNSDSFVITLGESYAMISFLDGILSWRSPIFFLVNSPFLVVQSLPEFYGMNP